MGLVALGQFAKPNPGVFSHTIRLSLVLGVCGIGTGSPVASADAEFVVEASFTIQLAETRPGVRNSNKRKRKGAKQSVIEARVAESFPKEWRSQNAQKKVLKEVSRRNRAAANKFLTEGIAAHEGGSHKGHTVGRHVSVSKKELEARIRHEKQKNGKTESHYSSFKNLKEANRLIDKALRDPNIRSSVKNWIKTINAKEAVSRKEIPGNKIAEKKLAEKRAAEKEINGRQVSGKEGKELIIKIRDTGAVTGLAVSSHNKKAVEARGIYIRLVENKNSVRGWSVQTAYPTVR